MARSIGSTWCAAPLKGYDSSVIGSGSTADGNGPADVAALQDNDAMAKMCIQLRLMRALLHTGGAYATGR